MAKRYLARPAKRKPPTAQTRRRYDIAGKRLLPRNRKTTAQFYSPSAFELELLLHPNLEPPRKAVSASRGSSGADNKINLLPPELLLDIAKLLPIEALYNFAQTCKRIERVLHECLYQQQGERLLHWAASAGKRVPAQRAIQYKQHIDVNFVQSGKTALAQAIAKQEWYYGDFASVTELLLEHDCIDLTDATNGISMLETAIENGAHPVVDRLLKEDQGKIDCILKNGQTPLMTAAWNGHKGIVDLLIRRGADVNQRTSSSAVPIGSPRTALALVIGKIRPHNVGLRQHDDELAGVAELLLKQNAIDLTDETNGIPMLKTAIEKGVAAVVDRLLEEHQDNINILFENGQTPLITASRNGQRHIVNLLIRRGADVNQRTGPITVSDEFIRLRLHDGFGGDTWTALAMASMYGHEDVVRRLLECEAIDTDVVAKETETPVSSWRHFFDESAQEPRERKIFSRQGSALFWAVVKERPRCVLALLQSDRVSLSTEELTRLQNITKSAAAELTKVEGAGLELRCILWLLKKCKGMDETRSRLAKLQGVTASTLQEVVSKYLLKDFFHLTRKKFDNSESVLTDGK
ncbi:Ankyrin repeat-containing domain protein [Cordyceps fumosorosea ARSEF 2679]|uniref:Ankyrin repeat-containing domain protein n=1 Tax=Cordyceps fumosorosea (strain ARSEF 2679) TaxID=1081104 RepID=A0A167C8R1_CORFA|nr:Ankyrin repeat-containing domain protein [Cordyceps fumosorosea ARSEF 2679]OAA40906.1 Ankyrin repeat-containing domain protein [Cordyceps fumosorosea ARSEF 2679]